MKKSDYKIALCYNVRPSFINSGDEEKFAEFDPPETIESISQSLKELGFKVITIEFNEEFVERLKTEKPNLVFNIAEGFRGEDRESQAPAIYEFLGIPYTGSTPLGHIFGLNKLIAKVMLEYHGIKTPKYWVFDNLLTKDLDINIEYPAIVKPIHEGSSIGIHNNAVVRNMSELIERVNYVISNFHQEALVEKFIEGREFNQAIIGNKNPIQFPIVEIDYSTLPPNIEKFSSFEVKTILDDPSSTICPARITEEERQKICKTTLAAYRICKIRDYCRIDLRMDNNGEIYILEFNTTPGIAPSIKENNSMVKAIRTYGWTYTQMIEAILNASFERYNIVFD